tara:strand:+ start:1290 stop:1592 length:303 start_codon:yes stop_codon:yes gene_type:complete
MLRRGPETDTIYTDTARRRAALYNHLDRVTSVHRSDRGKLDILGLEAAGMSGPEVLRAYYDVQEEMWRALCKEIRAANPGFEGRPGWVYTAAKALSAEVA